MTTVTHERQAFGALALALVMALPALAQAENLLPRDEGFMKEPKSVAYRRFKLDGKSDLGVFGAFSMKNKLTEHFGGGFTYDYQLNEYLALDLMLEGGFGGLTNLASNIRATARLSGTGDDLADAGALLATGQAGLRFTPIYGKMNLSSELAVHFNFYFNGGAGAALVQFNSILTCKTNLGSSTKCPGDAFRTDTLPRPAFNVGGGLRFWIDDLLSARVEVRDIIFTDHFYEQVNLKTPEGTGHASANAGVSHVPLVLIGVGFLL